MNIMHLLEELQELQKLCNKKRKRITDFDIAEFIWVSDPDYNRKKNLKPSDRYKRLLETGGMTEIRETENFKFTYIIEYKK